MHVLPWGGVLLQLNQNPGRMGLKVVSDPTTCKT